MKVPYSSHGTNFPNPSLEFTNRSFYQSVQRDSQALHGLLHQSRLQGHNQRRQLQLLFRP